MTEIHGHSLARFQPRFMPSFIFACVSTALLCLPVWPGLMSYDSLYAYKQSIQGVETALWPPMYDYLFFLSRSLGAGTGGLFAAQTFTIFFSVGIILSTSIRRYWVWLAGLVFCLVGFYWFPTLRGTVSVLWKDVPVASFSLLSIAVLLVANRYRSIVAASFSVAFAAAAASLRWNGLPLIAPLLGLIVYSPVGSVTTRRSRMIAGLMVSVGVFAAFASTEWRLPDFRRIPSGAEVFLIVPLWDMVGMSACAGSDVLPSDYAPRTVSDLRALYNPRHVNITLLMPPPGIKPLVRPAGDDHEIISTWLRDVSRYPGCYLSVRAAVFRQQVGMTRGAVFYPTAGGIDPNPYGLHLAFPAEANVTISSISQTANEWWRRSYILFCLAFAAGVLTWVRNLPSRLLVMTLLLSVFLYQGLLFFIAPEADGRYIFASQIFCIIAVVLTGVDAVESANPR